MAIPRFHVPGVATDETPRLTEGAARHARSVLRVRPGDELRAFDDGREFAATVLDVGRHDVSLRRGAETAPAPEAPVAIHLITSPLKGDLTEQVIRQATELGVARITVARFDRTDAAARGAALGGRVERWSRVLVSAVEQCGRARLPSLDAADSLTEAAAGWPDVRDARDELRFVAVEPSLPTATEAGGAAPTAPATVRVAVGPAGGLTEDEVSFLADRGFRGLRLGGRTLRAETACVAAIAVLVSRFEDARA